MKQLKQLTAFIISAALTLSMAEAKADLSDHLLFKDIGIEEGLSQISVTDILEDDLGRMWFATRDGLNCWDGKHMRNIMSSSNGNAIMEDISYSQILKERNFIWGKHKKGISRLDLHTFTTKYFPIDEPLSMEVFNNEVLVSNDKGIHVFNEDSESFVKAELQQKVSEPIVKMKVQNDSILWMGTRSGKLVRYNGELLKQYNLSNSKHIYTILPVDDQIWVGTDGEGAYSVDTDNDEIRCLSAPGGPLEKVNPFIRSMDIDQKGFIWIGTYRGLYSYCPMNNKLQKFVHQSGSRYSITDNSIHKVMVDKVGNLWIGTYFGGVNFCNLNLPIKVYEDIFNTEDAGQIIVGKILEDSHSNLWIATEGKGLYYYNRRKSHADKIGTGPEGLSDTNIKALYMDPEETHIYIGTHRGGLNILDLETGKICNFSAKEMRAGIIPYSISSIKRYGNHLLLGAEYGLFLYNIRTKQFKRFFSNEEEMMIGNNITCIEIDQKGKIWIGTPDKGIFVINPETRHLEHYCADTEIPTKLTPGYVTEIKKDSQNRIWICTENGLNIYDPQKENIEQITQKTYQLPSNSICDVVETSFGNTWIMSRRGFSRYDMVNEKIYNYNLSGGIPLTELNGHASLLSSDGELFIGGISGMVSFQEDLFIRNRKPHNVLLSDLSINNRHIGICDSTNILPQDIGLTSSITLDPDSHDITINYSTCSYFQIPENKFQYRLEGLKDEWTDAEYETTAKFTNIPHGKYTFQVRATDESYNPIGEIRSLSINIRRPWYLTWYALAGYFLLGITIIVVFLRLFINRKVLSEKLDLEQKARKRNEELNSMRLKLFTDISHEFISPLTVIIGLQENVLESPNLSPSLRMKMREASKNALRLRFLVKELMDLRKLEQGYLKLKIQKRDIVQYTKDILNYFDSYTKSRKLKATFESDFPNYTLWFDPWQIEIVIFNILTNAFKHLPEKEGKIRFHLSEDGEYINLSIFNNGPSIQPDMQEKIFEGFFQNDEESSEGVGVGLALSRSIMTAHKGLIRCSGDVENGAKFRISFHKGHEHFDKNITELYDEEKTDFKNNPEYLKMIENIQTDEEEKQEKNMKKILIVSKDTAIRGFLQELLHRNHTLKNARSEEEGLNTALKVKPELIIINIDQESIKGIEMTKKLRRNIITSQIPIILLSDNDSEDEKLAGLKAGANDFMVKPFNPQMLQVKIENLLLQKLTGQASSGQGSDMKLSNLAPADQQFMIKAEKIVSEHMNDYMFGVDKFAKEMRLSRTAFFNRIKLLTGMTPNDYITRLRMEKAAGYILDEPTKSIAEISYIVGFNSPAYFTQCFKNHYGVTPSKYGKSVK